MTRIVREREEVSVIPSFRLWQLKNLRPFTETGDSEGEASEEPRALGGTLGTYLN